MPLLAFVPSPLRSVLCQSVHLVEWMVCVISPNHCAHSNHRLCSNHQTPVPARASSAVLVLWVPLFFFKGTKSSSRNPARGIGPLCKISVCTLGYWQHWLRLSRAAICLFGQLFYRLYGPQDCLFTSACQGLAQVLQTCWEHDRYSLLLIKILK